MSIFFFLPRNTVSWLITLVTRDVRQSAGELRTPPSRFPPRVQDKNRANIRIRYTHKFIHVPSDSRILSLWAYTDGGRHPYAFDDSVGKHSLSLKLK